MTLEPMSVKVLILFDLVPWALAWLARSLFN